MFKMILYPFRGFGTDLRSLGNSLYYILHARFSMLRIILIHLWNKGDSADLASATSPRLTTEPSAFDMLLNKVCPKCTERAFSLRSNLHKGTVRDVADVAKLGSRNMIEGYTFPGERNKGNILDKMPPSALAPLSAKQIRERFLKKKKKKKVGNR